MLTVTGRSKEAEPLVVKPRDACRLLVGGRTRLYELLAARELDSFSRWRVAQDRGLVPIHRYIQRQLSVFGASDRGEVGP